MIPAEISKYESKRLELRFKDDQIVKARLIHVDVADRQEIIYELLEVVQSGDQVLPRRAVGDSVVTPLSDLQSFTVLEAAS